MDDFEIVIGLEVHVQLATESKMFCSCGTEFGLPPNTQTCPVCLGLPGVLPVINKKAVELGAKAALAFHCEVAHTCKFDRKNYFYPDLPKGYQISQFDIPLSTNGFIMIPSEKGEKRIGITRAHLEEDAGKLTHGTGMDNRSYVDLNRVGVPLLEIVSEPDISTPEEAYDYLKELKTILEYVEVSDCNMQEGSLRCDANISLRPKGATKLGTKTEIKNLNSFNFIKRALHYEAERQAEILRKGGTIKQATFTWVESENRTEQMRSKEYAHDYRYFPEPDLGPLVLQPDWIQALKDSLPELPRQRVQRMMAQYKIEEKDAWFLTRDKREADYFEDCMKGFDDSGEIINWIKGKIYSYMNEKSLNITKFPIRPDGLVELLNLVKQKKVNRNAAKEIFDQMIASGKPASSFAKSKEKITDPAILNDLCKKAMEKYPKLVEDYRTNPNALNSLVGQAMRDSQGRGDAEKMKEILTRLLS